MQADPNHSESTGASQTSYPKAFADRVIGRITLAIGNTAGFCGVLAMPLWISAITDLPGMSIRGAGTVGSCYIGGLMLGSVLTAPSARRINRKAVATAGFSLMALCLISAKLASSTFGLGIFFLVAGIGSGSGLAAVHSFGAASRNPPRVFALINYGMVAFAIVFFGTAPHLTQQFGSEVVIMFTAGIGAFAALGMLLLLPSTPAGVIARQEDSRAVGWRSISPALWLAFGGTTLFLGGQDAVFSYVNAMGKSFGFDAKSISSVLALSPVINTVAPLVASVIAGRVVPVAVAAWCSLAMIVVAIVIGVAPSFFVFGAAICLFMFTTAVCGAFLLGMTAMLDPTGRSSAAMPAVMLFGSSFGPVGGGLIAQQFGFHAVGYCGAVVIGASAVVFFALRRVLAGAPSAGMVTAGST